LHATRRGSLLAYGKDCPLPLTSQWQIDSGFGTRLDLSLLIEVNNNASKETPGREEVLQKNEKGDRREQMGKGKKGKGGVEKACEKIAVCLKQRRERLEKLV